MNRVLSTHVFVNHRLTVAWLSRIQQAGIPAVEIFCARQHLDYRDKAQIAELGHWFRDSELKLHSLHSPMYTDEIWGRSGPHAVSQHHRAGEGTALADGGRDQARARNRGDDPVPLPDPAPGRERRGVRHAQVRRRLFRAGRAEPVRPPARRRSAAGEHTERPFERQAPAAIRGVDAHRPRLRRSIPATPI